MTKKLELNEIIKFFKNKIGQRIKDKRIEKKMSVKKLAELSGVSERYIYILENYSSQDKTDKYRKFNPTLEVLVSLSFYLEIPLPELMKFDLTNTELKKNIEN